MIAFFDYTTLRIIWWTLLGVLLIGFALTDGWDLGAAALLPFVARTDVERRLVINSIGKTWEGNQVWFILGGGAIFAAWPFVYAVSFSGFYLAMFLLLAALILRPVGFKYRSKKADPAWRNRWDMALFVGGIIPALVFGVAVGNVLRGIPFRLDSDLRSFYEGSLIGLFTPFPLLCGILSVGMLAFQGASWITLRVQKGPVYDRAEAAAKISATLSLVMFLLGGCWVIWGDIGFKVTSATSSTGPSNPLRATTVFSAGAWWSTMRDTGWTLIAPALGILGAAAGVLWRKARTEVGGLVCSSVSILGVISTVGLSMFPVILPSSVDAHSSLLVWNASSSEHTLALMLVATVVFLPLVLVYTIWVYKILWGRITEDDVLARPVDHY